MLSSSDLEFFALVSASRSLTAAARQLNVSPSAVSQRLKNLEVKIGTRLIDRSASRFKLTSEGAILASTGQHLRALIEEVVDDLAQHSRSIAGRIKVTASHGFGRRQLSPLLASFAAGHPRLKIDFTLLDHPAEMRKGGFDIAFHVGPWRNLAATLGVRKLASNVRLLCASPAYLQHRAAPLSIAEIATHDCIALDEGVGDPSLWQLRRKGRSPETVRIQAVLSTNDGETAKCWALAGMGILLRSAWDVASELQSGQLRRILPDYTSDDWDIVALLPTRKDRRSLRVEALLDHISRRLPLKIGSSP